MMISGIPNFAQRLPLFDLTAGYVQRGIGAFPHMSTRGPWTFEQAYEVDVERLAGPVDRPELHFATPIGAKARAV